MITKDEFDAFPALQPFAHGESVDGPDGLNMLGTGKPIYWVAVKSVIGDWAMYYGWEHDYDFIANYGDKVHGRENILRVLSVTVEVLANYRWR